MKILYPKKNSILDDYIVTDQVLGKGLNRPVVLCINKETKVKYALKVLEDSSRSRKEIDIHWRASSKSQHIAKIIDLYESVRMKKKFFLLVIEYMEGGELFTKLINKTESFTERDVAKMMYQICSAVRDLHEMGIAHRDIKLENLLLTNNTDNAVIKLIDFGFAKEVKFGLSTCCYSLDYAPPEIIKNQNKNYDISCDIWSLGVVMFILCFGYPPFQNCDFDSLNLNEEGRIVTKEAKDLICSMLNVEPEKRIKIEDIMKNSWICDNSKVNMTKLISFRILKNNAENWTKVKEEFRLALEKMRIISEQNLFLMNMRENDSNNLLEKGSNKQIKAN